MKNLQFAHIEYSIQTRSIDIFTIGCDGQCLGCCNPEIKDWNLKGNSADYILLQVLKQLKTFPKLIDRIFLVGGDPVDAYYHFPIEMFSFVYLLRHSINVPIYLFTRHSIREIPAKLIGQIDYVKIGEYNPKFICDNNIQYGIKLATSNQRIIKIRSN